MSDLNEKMREIRENAEAAKLEKRAKAKESSDRMKENTDWLHPIFRSVSTEFASGDQQLKLEKGLISNSPCFKIVYGTHVLHISGTGFPDSVVISSTRNPRELNQNTVYNDRPNEERVKTALLKTLLSWYEDAVNNRL